jgi:hypothetical protein
LKKHRTLIPRSRDLLFHRHPGLQKHNLKEVEKRLREVSISNVAYEAVSGYILV